MAIYTLEVNYSYHQMMSSAYKPYIAHIPLGQEDTQGVQKLLTYSTVHTGGPECPEMLTHMCGPANCVFAPNLLDHPLRASFNLYRSHFVPGQISRLTISHPSQTVYDLVPNISTFLLLSVVLQR